MSARWPTAGTAGSLTSTDTRIQEPAVSGGAIAANPASAPFFIQISTRIGRTMFLGAQPERALGEPASPSSSGDRLTVLVGSSGHQRGRLDRGLPRWFD